ncbi:hypothetical protein B0H16DRAFT_1612704 [Mycena metata]|uniref:Uncharacterized protein n=1 Tax=Mycena metata TaxID=1033252 RepID=A0AAD7MHA8_9AGAR|nr:hypothetical protein B0H16DRAFT_1612704 [Mycena metata]
MPSAVTRRRHQDAARLIYFRLPTLLPPVAVTTTSDVHITYPVVPTRISKLALPRIYVAAKREWDEYCGAYTGRCGSPPVPTCDHILCHLPHSPISFPSPSARCSRSRAWTMARHSTCSPPACLDMHDARSWPDSPTYPPIHVCPRAAACRTLLRPAHSHLPSLRRSKYKSMETRTGMNVSVYVYLRKLVRATGCRMKDLNQTYFGW